jgi:hypothetical protein
MDIAEPVFAACFLLPPLRSRIERARKEVVNVPKCRPPMRRYGFRGVSKIAGN